MIIYIRAGGANERAETCYESAGGSVAIGALDVVPHYKSRDLTPHQAAAAPAVIADA